MLKIKFLLAFPLSLSLCSASFAEAISPVNADLHDKTGAVVGHVTVKPHKKGVSFLVTVKGLPPGMHGLHIHSVGKCDGPDFKSAGSHFALPGQMHGMENPKGPHIGDMPNLNVKADGAATLSFSTDTVTLVGTSDNSLHRTGGTALVIHEGQDDQKTDPSGNSGARIACAVLAQ
jgi:Cu-Zn family superoxide dismutase